MIECIKFKKYIKGTLLGFADLKDPEKGFILQGCTVHQKEGQRWVNLPSKEYTDENGEKRHFYIFRFIENQDFNEFKSQALKAVDKCVLSDIQNAEFENMFEQDMS